MKIYTKTGDAGETSLFGGGRVEKDHLRIAAYGTVDELNATLGIARAEIARAEAARGAPFDAAVAADLGGLLEGVQNRLFDLGAELATPSPETLNAKLLDDTHVAVLEGAIDRYEATLPPLKQFVLPGGSAPAAQLHLARCVCRRAERRMVTLAREETVRELTIRYMNRLSDLLFVAARVANRAAGEGDTPWTKAT